jgi:hypothetical protein
LPVFFCQELLPLDVNSVAGISSVADCGLVDMDLAVTFVIPYLIEADVKREFAELVEEGLCVLAHAVEGLPGIAEFAVFLVGGGAV